MSRGLALAKRGMEQPWVNTVGKEWGRGVWGGLQCQQRVVQCLHFAQCLHTVCLCRLCTVFVYSVQSAPTFLQCVYIVYAVHTVLQCLYPVHKVHTLCYSVFNIFY